ncbi:hypothetical protein L6259_03150 [Candidatus Parcubacteria bacterium]|nr:hypothetical protein [Candidatus Parcubacteria bacterium]
MNCKSGQDSAIAPTTIKDKGEVFLTMIQYDIRKKTHPTIGEANTRGMNANEPEPLFFAVTARYIEIVIR